MRSRPRQLVVLFVFCCFLATPGILHGQEDAPAEAIPAAADPAQTTGNSPAWRDVSVRKLPTNFLSDQRDLWLFPGQVVQRRHWLPTIAVAGATAGLLAADAHDAPYFRRTASFRGCNRAFSGRATSLEVALV